MFRHKGKGEEFRNLSKALQFLSQTLLYQLTADKRGKCIEEKRTVFEILLK